MRLLISFLISVMLLSCQQTPERCENDALMEKPHGDSLPVFELSEGMPALRHFLDSFFEIALSNSENPSTFYLMDSLNTPCQFDPFQIELYRQIHIKPRGMFELLLNDRGLILLEGELRTIDNLDTIWKENVLNFGRNPSFAASPDRAFIHIHFSEHAPIDSLSKILSTIHHTQNEFIMEEARSKFVVPFCEIATDSIINILEKYPLNIFISWKEELIPPPPPVPLGSESLSGL